MGECEGLVRVRVWVISRVSTFLCTRSSVRRGLSLSLRIRIRYCVIFVSLHGCNTPCEGQLGGSQAQALRGRARPGRQAQWEERRLCRRLARAPEPCRPVASPLPTTSPEEGKRGVPRPEPAVPCGGAGAERSRAEPGSQHCPRGGCPRGASRPGLRLSVLACRCLHLCLMISGQCLRRVRLALRGAEGAEGAIVHLGWFRARA